MADNDVQRATEEIKDLAPDYAQLPRMFSSAMFGNVRRSRSYVSRKIVDLKVGNTEVIAKMIQKIAGGDLFYIETAAAYPKDYTETTEVAYPRARI